VDQNVVVDDITAPTATSSANVETCDGTVTDIGLTDVADNCTIPVVTYVLTGATIGSGTGDASSVVFAHGVTTVTYTVDDGNGNSTQYQFTVTYPEVEDIVVTTSDGTLTVTNSGSYQWIDCADNSIVTGETASTFTPATSGEYAVILTQGGCSDTSDCYMVTASGIGDKELNPGYEVYPNPAHDYVTIDMINEHTNVTLKVFDLTGKVLLIEERDRLIQTNLDISTFKAGMYMIQINSDQISSVARIMKE
jgi:Secretion system C-terminal sorting domain